MRQCIKNMKKRKALSDFTTASTLQSENYTLVTDGQNFVYKLNFDVSDSTKYRNGFLTFLIPQNTEMGFQKILILCRYDERQICPADNFLFTINQPRVKCEARETPHCILTTTATAK